MRASGSWPRTHARTRTCTLSHARVRMRRVSKGEIRVERDGKSVLRVTQKQLGLAAAGLVAVGVSLGACQHLHAAAQLLCPRGM